MLEFKTPIEFWSLSTFTYPTVICNFEYFLKLLYPSNVREKSVDMQAAPFSPVTDIKIVSQKERYPPGYFMVR